jgi:predicted acylesterase/phospholipase RssA
LEDLEAHFDAIRELKNLERRLIKCLVDRPEALDDDLEALLRYALALAQLDRFDAPDGTEVSLAREVDELRSWLLESIAPLLPKDGEPEIATIRELAPVLELRVDRTREAILEHYDDTFGAEHLDDELRHKELVLVLGGGGGSGLFHMGVFSLLAELDIEPSLIVGTSIGSALGLLRSLDRDYDPLEAARALPPNLEYDLVFRPFSGYSRFGFPGAFHLNLLRVARKLFENLLGDPDVRFSDLPIPLEVITCGIRQGYSLETEEYEEAAPDDEAIDPPTIRDRIRLFFASIRKLTENPQFLTPVVFGRDDVTEDFPVIEAVGFSCAIPGLLHFDVFHDDPATIGPLQAIFDRDELLRLCDGGVVNNVPSKVAWESVQSGKLGTRNTWITAFDVFAPVPRSSNVIWMPIQQIVRPSVLSNRPYADYHKTFRSPPSPLDLIVEDVSELQAIVQEARHELENDADYIDRALEPLPPYESWDFGATEGERAVE